jgi:hypothetical protein
MAESPLLEGMYGQFPELKFGLMKLVHLKGAVYL